MKATESSGSTMISNDVSMMDPHAGDWRLVLERIRKIGGGLDEIATSLEADGHVEDSETLSRLDRLQERFEAVLRQLSAFDDAQHEAIRSAKQELLSVVQNYQQNCRHNSGLNNKENRDRREHRKTDLH